MKVKQLVVATLVLSFNPMTAVHAQDTAILEQIRDYTYAILQNVNNLPHYLANLSQMALSWLAPDDSKSTSEIQANFTSLGNLLVQDITTQNNNTLQFDADAFGQPVSSFTQPRDNPAILKLLPPGFLNVNDVSYSTLIGLPPVPKIASSPLNYVRFASGLKINHTMPVVNWQGTRQDQLNYLSYYGTVTAVETFNSYVLSKEISEGNNLNTLQSDLVSKASNSDWLLQITSEELGKVLRQILMFDSQTYVIMTELLQTERQLVAAQAMTNTILINNNQLNESILVAKAQGQKPT